MTTMGDSNIYKPLIQRPLQDTNTNNKAKPIQKNNQQQTLLQTPSLFDKTDNNNSNHTSSLSAEQRKANIENYNKLSNLGSFCEIQNGKLTFKKFNSIFTSIPQEFAKRAKWAGNTLNYVIDYFQQGSEGNCALLSAIQAVGQLPDGGKSILEKTIKPVNGGYQVTFLGKKSGPGSKGNPVFVSKNAIANDSVKRRNKNSDLEVSILNQAVHRAVGSPPYNPGNMLTLLTGKRAKLIRPSDYNKLNANQKKACIAWWGNHAWAVEKYENGRYILRNPHNTSRREVKTTTPYRFYTIG